MMVIPHLILKRDGKILLTRRSSTQKIWANHWHCVTGGIEIGESPMEAIIREANEEIGIKVQNITLETITFVETKSFFDPLEKFYAVELFFVSQLNSEQNPINLEPLKQDSLGWFDPLNLPNPMIPQVAFSIQSNFDKKRYSEYINI